MASRLWPGLLVACACAPPPTAPVSKLPDKQALYGDPGLLPNRAGERARRELALAGEIAKGLGLLATVEALEVNVELESNPRAVITGTVPTAELETFRERAQQLSRAIVGADTEVQVFAAARQPSRDRPLDFGIAFALLGLGCSAGMLGERLRSQARAGRG